MKLKTLKDLAGGRINGNKIDRWMVDCDILKAEAVKWVKCCNGFMTLKDFKAFFNITEEDIVLDKSIIKRGGASK